MTAELRIAEGHDREEVMEMIDFLHQVTAPLRVQGDQFDPNASGRLTCALVMFAGGIVGELIGVGLISPKQKRQMTESMARNFRNGMDAGLKKVARIAATEGMVQ